MSELVLTIFFCFNYFLVAYDIRLSGEYTMTKSKVWQLNGLMLHLRWCLVFLVLGAHIGVEVQ